MSLNPVYTVLRELINEFWYRCAAAVVPLSPPSFPFWLLALSLYYINY